MLLGQIRAWLTHGAPRLEQGIERPWWVHAAASINEVSEIVNVGNDVVDVDDTEAAQTRRVKVEADSSIGASSRRDMEHIPL